MFTISTKNHLIVLTLTLLASSAGAGGIDGGGVGNGTKSYPKCSQYVGCQIGAEAWGDCRTKDTFWGGLTLDYVGTTKHYICNHVRSVFCMDSNGTVVQGTYYTFTFDGNIQSCPKLSGTLHHSSPEPDDSAYFQSQVQR